MRLASIVLAFLLLASCGDDAPEHHYVFCEDKDGAGWNLVDYEYDDKDYLIACTYQSPDQRQAYTARCTSAGCD